MDKHERAKYGEGKVRRFSGPHYLDKSEASRWTQEEPVVGGPGTGRQFSKRVLRRKAKLARVAARRLKESLRQARKAEAVASRAAALASRARAQSSLRQRQQNVATTFAQPRLDLLALAKSRSSVIEPFHDLALLPDENWLAIVPYGEEGSRNTNFPAQMNRLELLPAPQALVNEESEPLRRYVLEPRMFSRKRKMPQQLAAIGHAAAGLKSPWDLGSQGLARSPADVKAVLSKRALFLEQLALTPTSLNQDQKELLSSFLGESLL